MLTKQQVYDLLDQTGTKYSATEHPAVFTMEEIGRVVFDTDVLILKNLFLRDPKGRRHFLVSLPGHKTAGLAALSEVLGAGKLSFASEERLMKYLGLCKGAVTPLGVLNDKDCSVTVVFDREIAPKTVVGVHPCDNTATVALEFGELVKIVESAGNTVVYADI